MKIDYLKDILNADDKNANKLITQGLQEYSDKILKSINPLHCDALPFVIAVLETVLKSFKQCYPAADILAQDLIQNCKYETIQISIDKSILGGSNNGKKN